MFSEMKDDLLIQLATTNPKYLKQVCMLVSLEAELREEEINVYETDLVS